MEDNKSNKTNRHVISREDIREMEEKIKFIKQIKNFRNIAVLIKGLKKKNSELLLLLG